MKTKGNYLWTVVFNQKNSSGFSRIHPPRKKPSCQYHQGGNDESDVFIWRSAFFTRIKKWNKHLKTALFVVLLAVVLTHASWSFRRKSGGWKSSSWLIVSLGCYLIVQKTESRRHVDTAGNRNIDIKKKESLPFHFDQGDLLIPFLHKRFHDAIGHRQCRF